MGSARSVPSSPGASPGAELMLTSLLRLGLRTRSFQTKGAGPLAFPGSGAPASLNLPPPPGHTHPHTWPQSLPPRPQPGRAPWPPTVQAGCGSNIWLPAGSLGFPVSSARAQGLDSQVHERPSGFPPSRWEGHLPGPPQSPQPSGCPRQLGNSPGPALRRCSRRTQMQ